MRGACVMRRVWGILVVLVLLLLPRVAFAAEAITSKEQLDRTGVKIGTDVGNVAETAVRDELPNATVVYFDDKFLGYEAVAQGKVDAFAYDLRQM